MIKIVTTSSDSRLIFRTTGLIPHPEISVEIAGPDLAGEAEAFLAYVSNYVTTSGNQIRPGETMAYGYWLTKFQFKDSNTLETWEYNAEGSDFIKGANLTLRYWRDQHVTCKLHETGFQPPRPDQLTVISKGVLEGAPIKGVRYPSPAHMSGWWLVTDQYNGDIKSLKNEHTYHVTAARPDVVKYLALPHGFRFDSLAQDAWLDHEVATAAP